MMDKFIIHSNNKEKSNEGSKQIETNTQKWKNKEATGQELNKKVRENFDPNWLRIYP